MKDYEVNSTLSMEKQDAVRNILASMQDRE